MCGVEFVFLMKDELTSKKTVKCTNADFKECLLLTWNDPLRYRSDLCRPIE